MYVCTHACMMYARMYVCRMYVCMHGVVCAYHVYESVRPPVLVAAALVEGHHGLDGIVGVSVVQAIAEVVA